MDATMTRNILGTDPNVYETEEKYTTPVPDHTAVEDDTWRSVEMSHKDSEETDAPKYTNPRGSDGNTGSIYKSEIIPTLSRHDLQRAHSQIGRWGALQTNTTMVAMMEPVAEQNPDEISRKNTEQVQWEEIFSPLGLTTQRNIA